MQTLHGGCTATLFDICTTLPLAFVAGPGFWRMLGVSRTLTVSYLAPVFVGDEVLIECEIVQVGKRLATIKGLIKKTGDNLIVATCEHGKYNAGPAARV
jgi:acyl-coenzyme A thioesterase PaaI-like protein